MDEAITTLIADDHFVVRSGLRVMLEQIEGVRVVQEAASGDELLQAARALRPRLVVTDIAMPGQDGLTVLDRLRDELPATRLLVVSMHDEPYIVRRAIQCGAHGYLLKGGTPMELQHAVHTVLTGRPFFCAEVTQRLLAPAEPDADTTLTPRQIEILKRLAVGMTSKEIGFELGLSSKTVDAHRARIMDRLQIRDPVSLALYCVRQGLIDPGRALVGGAAADPP